MASLWSQNFVYPQGRTCPATDSDQTELRFFDETGKCPVGYKRIQGELLKIRHQDLRISIRRILLDNPA